jgi:hypothetical protein
MPQAQAGGEVGWTNEDAVNPLRCAYRAERAPNVWVFVPQGNFRRNNFLSVTFSSQQWTTLDLSLDLRSGSPIAVDHEHN